MRIKTRSYLIGEVESVWSRSRKCNLLLRLVLTIDHWRLLWLHHHQTLLLSVGHCQDRLSLGNISILLILTGGRLSAAIGLSGHTGLIIIPIAG